LRITFPWTVEPLIGGRKTVARRCWSSKYFNDWVRAWRGGRYIHQAWDKSPSAGGKQIGWIRLTCEPYQEPLEDMPEADVQKEGGYWLSKEGFISYFIENFGHLVPCFDRHRLVSVLRFEYLPPEAIPPEPTQGTLEL